MMKCDYKIRHIVPKKNGIEVSFAIYEGEISTLDEMNVEGNIQPVTRYRRSGLVYKGIELFDKPFNGSALHTHMKNLLKEVPNRTPIDEQS